MATLLKRWREWRFKKQYNVFMKQEKCFLHWTEANVCDHAAKAIIKRCLQHAQQVQKDLVIVHYVDDKKIKTGFRVVDRFTHQQSNVVVNIVYLPDFMKDWRFDIYN